MPRPANTGSPTGYSVQEENLTIRDHQDPDKHWIGEALAVPTQTEIAATIGSTSSPGDSPFVARADHMHKIANGSITDAMLQNDKVNVAGDTMSGILTLAPDGAITALRIKTVAPTATSYISGYDHGSPEARTGRVEFNDAGPMRVVSELGELQLIGTGGVSCPSSNFEVGNYTTAGFLAEINGRTTSRWNSTTTSAIPNYIADRTGSVAIAAGEPFMQFKRSSATIGRIEIATATSVGYITTSDLDQKQNIKEIDDPLGIIKKWHPVEFEWKAEPGTTNHGLIAQELYEVQPELVSPGDGTEDRPWGIDYSRLVPCLIAAVQVLANKVEALEAQIG